MVEYALFGTKFLRSQVARGSDTLVVACEFEAGGRIYEVIRSAGRKPSLTLGVLDGSENLTQSTVTDTQSVIDGLLGLTRETFRASCYLAQGDGGAFTEARPDDRKAVLAEILGLGTWGWLEDVARAEQRTLSQDADREHGRLEQLRRELEDLPERRAAQVQARAGLATAREGLALAEAAVQGLEARERAAAGAVEAREALRHATGDRDKATQARSAVQRRLADYPSLKELESAAAGRPGLEAVVTAGEAERERWNEIRAKDRHDERRLDDLEKQLARQPKDPGVCGTCGQPLLTDDAKRRHQDERDQLQAEHDRLASRPPLPPAPNVPTAELRAAVEAENRLAFVRAAVAQIAEADQVIAMLDERIADLTPKAVGADVEDAGEREALASQREVVARYERDLTRVEADIERLTLTEQTLLRDQTVQRRRQAKLDLLGYLVKAYGRDGVPAMIVENVALPAIEAEAGRILADLGTDFSVELRTQRLTQKGEARDALDIIVRTGPDESPYESFSGGERTRVNLALRIALARLLATRRGAQVRCLLIDEPEFLDASGMERLAAVLGGLRDDFDRICVVSHHDALRHAFDQVIQIERNGDGSHIA